MNIKLINLQRSVKANTLQSILNQGIQELTNMSCSASLDAQLLLAYTLGKTPTYLVAWPETVIAEADSNIFSALIASRKKGVPLAYLTGSKEFWSLDFKVTPDVLIPRPDTELLVETALELCTNKTEVRILDLGTGSGAISIALASELPSAEIIATDLSEKALIIAKENTARHQIKNIELIQSDWYSAIPKQRFDIIVSNPPYIRDDDPHLQTDIRYEPYSALVAEQKGLADIEKITSGVSDYLSKDGHLLIEHSYDQSEDVLTILRTKFSQAKTLKDYASNDRLSLAHQLL
ncbi:MAG: Protein-N(5)-glutamine methyltransferase PrmC, methylates polypeptide chain release factors RF1 and RF2 [uncultured Thiotrichaceae bacterium]|uniref:Release factor glutamine methyltransferase n=1 Tax=uncultured Thiotrichaceae bacterium TaxID=298394 RepID=A0A6S6T1F6_9GAMM|nr:MAG: Protein-N(5)-glutamine methyltransferase PrmC, methylates polypeptide chain release factors RF1 and RF2 [uncultured Thiotrichaceae bacterium]